MTLSPLDNPAENALPRRTFLGYVLAGSTLAVAAQIPFAPSADAATPVPSNPQQFDVFDLTDLIRESCRLTNALLTIEIGRDGVATFALPRAEVGQGITTAFAMVIAEELAVPVAKVKVTLSDARPELIFNQLTGGSSSLFSIYEPVRAAAALAKQRLVGAAAAQWGVDPDSLSVREGVVFGPEGRLAPYGALTEAAASPVLREQRVTLGAATGKIVGKPRRRLDALAAVTGRKAYAMDLDVKDALPTMICRAPTLKGTVRAIGNRRAVEGMPGVTHVGVISSGVAVRARTFGQCVDAVRALKVDWNPGTVDDESNATVGKKLAAAELPLPPLPDGLVEVVEETFTFNFRSGSPLETNCAIADVRADRAEVWSSLKFPILAQQDFAALLGLPENKVTVHVVEGGGSFGRHLFDDAAREAVQASKLFGAPVKLMWHRTDDSRHGRMHPMATSRVRMTVTGDSVTSYEQRHTSVATDFTHGLGEMFGAFAARQGNRQYGNLAVSEGIFTLTTGVPYDFGPTAQLNNEIFKYDDFPTSSVRNIYAPDVVTARELMVDQAAKKLKMDPLEFRLAFLKRGDDRLRAVVERARKAGRWGRAMPKGTAQGIAIHNEYKSRIAVLVEIDTRPETVNRTVRDAYTGPRVTAVTVVCDVGLPINPLGLEAQMQGGAMDGIAQALSAGLHVVDGLPLEGSWDDYRYTRQWNVPLKFQVVVMPPTTDHPGGAGELACGVTQAAVACAYARAVGKVPTEFPLNFRAPLGFRPKSKTPPIPQSPTNGLRFTR